MDGVDLPPGGWPSEWGERPERMARPYWWPPGLILRQVVSALYVGAPSHWRHVGAWIRTYGFKCLPGAAGSRSMGCIGFPAHPVWEMTTACNLDREPCSTRWRTTSSAAGTEPTLTSTARRVGSSAKRSYKP